MRQAGRGDGGNEAGPLKNVTHASFFLDDSRAGPQIEHR
jgi:hypothetical protein